MRGRLGRWYLVAIAGIAVLLIAALALLGVDRAMRVSALAETRTAATNQATILAAGLALQKAGVIEADVDVKAAVDALVDTDFPVAAQ